MPSSGWRPNQERPRCEHVASHQRIDAADHRAYPLAYARPFAHSAWAHARDLARPRPYLLRQCLSYRRACPRRCMSRRFAHAYTSTRHSTVYCRYVDADSVCLCEPVISVSITLQLHDTLYTTVEAYRALWVRVCGRARSARRLKVFQTVISESVPFSNHTVPFSNYLETESLNYCICTRPTATLASSVCSPPETWPQTSAR